MASELKPGGGTMSRLSRRDVLKTGAIAVGATFPLSTGVSGSPEFDQIVQSESSSRHLIGSWMASHQQPTSEAGFTDGFCNQTLRNIVRTSVGGSELRVRLANSYVEEPVTIDDVSVGTWDMETNTIRGTAQPVTFGGERSVTIPEGARFYSDPVSVEVPPEQNLAVDLYFAEQTPPPATHADSLKTGYVSSGNHVGETTNDSFDSPPAGETDFLSAWFYIEAIDVVNPDITGAVACLGDSITDGVGSSYDTDSTYPDFLAERLNDEPSIKKSVLNAGIGGNRLINDDPANGINGLARLDEDALSQTGVTDIILLEGINDIGGDDTTAEALIPAMKQVVAQAHAQGVRVYGGTLTPIKGSVYYSETHEQERQQVNEFVRTSGAFDGVVDFDKAVRDPDNPSEWIPEYHSGDFLHPSDAGYRAMAETVDLNLLRNRGQQEQNGGRNQNQMTPTS